MPPPVASPLAPPPILTPPAAQQPTPSALPQNNTPPQLTPPPSATTRNPFQPQIAGAPPINFQQPFGAIPNTPTTPVTYGGSVGRVPTGPIAPSNTPVHTQDVQERLTRTPNEPLPPNNAELWQRLNTSFHNYPSTGGLLRSVSPDVPPGRVINDQSLTPLNTAALALPAMRAAAPVRMGAAAETAAVRAAAPQIAPVPRPVTPTPPTPGAVPGMTPPPISTTVPSAGLPELGRAANTLSRHDYFSGVVGPARAAVDTVRNLGAGAGNLIRGNFGAAGGNLGAATGSAIRGGIQLAAPGTIHSIDETINRPGTIDQDRVQRRLADRSEQYREAPSSAELIAPEAWARRGRNLLTMAGNSFSSDPEAPGLGRYAQGNLDQLGSLGSAAVRNPHGVVGSVGRFAGEVQEGLTGQSATNPGAPSGGDVYRGLRDEYVNAVTEYHSALRSGVPQSAALQIFQDRVRELPARFSAVQYRSPDGAGLGAAERDLLHSQALDRLRLDPTYQNDPAAQADIARLAQNSAANPLFSTPPLNQDARTMHAPFPTAWDRAEAARGLGLAPQPTQGGIAGLSDSFFGGRHGTVPQSSESADVMRQRLQTRLAPIESDMYTRVGESAMLRDPEVVAALRRNQNLTSTPSPSNAGVASVPSVPGPTPQIAAGPTGGGEFPTIPKPEAVALTPPANNSQPGDVPPKPDAPPPPPPEVQRELAQGGSGVPQAIATLAGGDAGNITGDTITRALEAAKTVTPPANLTEYWEQLPPASQLLAIAGLSLTAISFLRSAFGGDDDDEPGFLMRVLPYLGMGAAAWGLGGGTLWGENGVSMPKLDQFQNLGSSIRGSFRGLRMGAGSE